MTRKLRLKLADVSETGPTNSHSGGNEIIGNASTFRDRTSRCKFANFYLYRTEDMLFTDTIARSLACDDDE
jgi:hypothetical protein